MSDVDHMPIKTRREAFEAGSMKFWTGRPCKYGHSSPRWVASGACCLCQSRYTTKFQSKRGVEYHPDSISESEKAAGVVLMSIVAHPDDIEAIRKIAREMIAARGAIPPAPPPSEVFRSPFAHRLEELAAYNAAKASPLERMMDRLAPPAVADTAVIQAQAATAPNVLDLGDGSRFVNDPAEPYILLADGTKISC